MATVDSNAFEIERRGFQWSMNNTLDDGSTSLLYDGDPNNVVDGNTDGESKLYSLLPGATFFQSNGTWWIKTASPNTWNEIATGGSSGGSTTTKHVITRGSFEIDMDQGDGSPGPYFLTMQENSFAGDSLWDDITYTHTLVLPYDATVNRVVLRGTAINGATVAIGMHTNREVTDTNSVDYKFFPITATESVSATHTYNNESQIYTFTDIASARAGDTLGISVSSDQPIGMVNATIVLDYDTT